MKLPRRAAAALAALLLSAIFGAPPGFAQDLRILDYSEDGDGLCRAGQSAVADRKCTLRIPTGEGPVFAGIYPSPTFSFSRNPSTVNKVRVEGALTIPVNLVLDGRIDGGGGTRDPFVPRNPRNYGHTTHPTAGLLVHHGHFGFDNFGPGADIMEYPPLTVTIEEAGEVAVDPERSDNEPRSGDGGLFLPPAGVELIQASNADLTLINRGTILSAGWHGIHARAALGRNGNIIIRNTGVIAGAREADGEFLPVGSLAEMPEGGHGIWVSLPQAENSNDVTIEHTGNGLILAHTVGIHARSTNPAGNIRVIAGGTSTIEAGNYGIWADVAYLDSDDPTRPSDSLVWIRVEEGARVAGGLSGIIVDHRNINPPTASCDPIASEVMFRACVTVLGTVEGMGGPSAENFNGAVTLRGDNILTIGPKGRIVSHNPDVPAIRIINSGTANSEEETLPTVVIRYLIQDGEVGSVEGPTTRGTFVDVETGRSANIDYQFWVLADNLDLTELLEEIETGTLSEEMQRQIRAADLMEGGTFARGLYDAQLDVETGEFVETLSSRVEVYEALPSVLLSANRPISHDARRHAPRVDGWWLWTEAADGSWKADRSTTDAEYDYDRYSFEAGVDLTVGEHAVVGLSAHHRNIDADTDDGGNIEADGIGVGVSATFTGDEAYVTGQASATWYEVDLSDAGIGTLRNNVDGFGYSIGAEVGRRMEHGDLVVAPRIGLTYSRIDLDDFQGRADPQLEITDSVSPDDGESFVGRVGIGFEHGKVYGSLDLEHEFSEDERRVEAEDAVLESESDDIWVRASLGGIHEWGEGRYSLNVQLGYASSGSDNDEFGGSLTLQGRF